MLQQLPESPPTFTTTPALVLWDAKRLIEGSRQVHDHLPATVTPATESFDNVIAPLAHAENVKILGARRPVFYNSVLTNSELREASRQARVFLDAFVLETSMRKDLFALVDAVMTRSGNDKSNNTIPDAESRSLLAKLHQDYASSGLKLARGPARDRFRTIQNRIKQLSTQLRKNVAEADDVIWLQPSELEGVPGSILSQLVPDEEGKLRLWLAEERVPVAATLQSARNAETRRRVELADNTRCRQNISLFQELVALCDEATRLLGYSNYAAFSMQENMA